MARTDSAYQCVASSVEGFVQQVAVSYLTHGYFFFVLGHIREGKEPEQVDVKLIERYGIGVSKWARARKKQAGIASMQYIRFERTFLLMATHGKSSFFEAEKESIRDARRTPIRVFGYSLSYRAGHPHVRIDQEEFKRFKAWFLELALHRKRDDLEAEFQQLRFVPYAPVRSQVISIWRHVNRKRKEQGQEQVRFECLRLKRPIFKIFSDRSCK